MDDLRTKLDAAIAEFPLIPRNNFDNIKKLYKKHIENLLNKYKTTTHNISIINYKNRKETLESIINKYLKQMHSIVFNNIYSLKNMLVAEKNDENINKYNLIIKMQMKAFANFIDSQIVYFNIIMKNKDQSMLTYVSNETFSPKIITRNDNSIGNESIIEYSVNGGNVVDNISQNEISDSELKRNLEAELIRKDKHNIENEIVKIKDMEHNIKIDITSKHELKERIHLYLRKFALLKHIWADELIIHYKECARKHEDLIRQHEDKTKKQMMLIEELKIHKQLLQLNRKVHKYDNKFIEEISAKRIRELLMKFNTLILQNKEIIVDTVLSEVEFILNQGTLDSDMRFLEKLEKQKRDIDKFDTPRFFKLCVQLGIAKKYVCDIIYLKKKRMFRNYYDPGHK